MTDAPDQTGLPDNATWFETGVWKTSNGFNLVAAVALVAMMLHVNLDVLGRFLFNAPLPMTTEVVSAYYMVAVVFLPLAAIEWRDGHISVEIITQFIGDRPQRLLLVMTGLLSAAYFAAIAWRTWLVAVDKYQIGEFITGVATLSIWPTRFLVPLGCGLIVLVLLIKAARRVFSR